MAIGILVGIIGVILLAISSAGIGNVEHPAQKDRKVNYPFPEEL